VLLPAKIANAVGFINNERGVAGPGGFTAGGCAAGDATRPSSDCISS
jgi:hypothetical protein